MPRGGNRYEGPSAGIADINVLPLLGPIQTGITHIKFRNPYFMLIPQLIYFPITTLLREYPLFRCSEAPKN